MLVITQRTIPCNISDIPVVVPAFAFARATLGESFGVPRVLDEEALDGDTVDKMGFNDFLDVVHRDAAVPDFVGIDNHRGTEFAGVEAAAFIGAMREEKTALLQFLIEFRADSFRIAARAASAWMTFVAKIFADKQVPFVARHCMLTFLVFMNASPRRPMHGAATKQMQVQMPNRLPSLVAAIHDQAVAAVESERARQFLRGQNHVSDKTFVLVTQVVDCP